MFVVGGAGAVELPPHHELLYVDGVALGASRSNSSPALPRSLVSGGEASEEGTSHPIGSSPLAVRPVVPLPNRAFLYAAEDVPLRVSAARMAVLSSPSRKAGYTVGVMRNNDGRGVVAVIPASLDERGRVGGCIKLVKSGALRQRETHEDHLLGLEMELTRWAEQ
jgi:hypothetical protein